MRASLHALLALAASATVLAAQQRPRVTGRPVRPDSAAQQDTARRPSGADTIIERLLKLQGYTPIEYKGDSAEFRTATGILRLRGSPEVVRQGDRLSAADSIVYRERTQSIEAFGQPRVTGQTTPEIAGNVMFYDLRTRRASVQGAKTTFTQGSTWYVYDSDATVEGTQHVYVNGGKFTTCDLEDPHYHFESDKIMFVRDRILVARPARLYFGNVPVLWFPFIVQDLARGRRSGLLTPRFGVNDIVRTGGGGRRIEDLGYYWAINDYMGAQVKAAWDSRAYTSLTGGLQYRWRQQLLDGSVNFSNYWRDGGGRVFALNTQNSWRPSERTNINVHGQYSSSSQFVRRVSVDPREVTQDLRSSASLDRRFDWGTLGLQATREQSIANGRVDWTLPSFAIVPKTISLWGGSTLSLSASGEQSLRRFEDEEIPDTSAISRLNPRRDQTRTRFQLSQSLQAGPVSLSTAASLNRELLAGLVRLDTVYNADALERGAWQASVSYRQDLIGSTYIAPNISLSQDILRDDRRTGRRVPAGSLQDLFNARLPGGALAGDSLDLAQYVSAPVRLSFGASLNTDVYGFFPGFGPFSRIRHHVKPTASYSFVPAVEQTREQDLVFGRQNARTQNLVTVGMTNIFTAKLQTPAPPPAIDTLADTTALARARAAPPADAQQVVLLDINTSALQYDFTRATEGQSGFTTTTLSNTIRSDYLRGLNLSITHDLFDRSGVTRPGELGRFSPFLTSVNTSFSLGEGSALFRFLGLSGRREETLAAPPPAGVIPGPIDAETLPLTSPGTFGNNLQPVGRGPWNAALSYTLLRSREDPLLGPVFGAGRNEQNITGNVSFSPTLNWAADWSTSFRVNEGKFGQHSFRLRRDLHRWQANFDISRTITGNTSFSFYVFLVDVPEAKAEYRESQIGGRRR